MVSALVTAETDLRTNSRSDLDSEVLDLRQAYADHFQSVWRSLQRLGVPRLAMDDAVQDVFLVVHRRRSEFAARSSLRTWILGIALRVAKDYRRAARRYQARVQRYANEVALTAEMSNPGEAAERREANRVLHSILDELNDDERAVFVLVELEQCAVREAAVACGVSLPTCQRRLRRARIAFEAALLRRSDEVPGRSKL